MLAARPVADSRDHIQGPLDLLVLLDRQILRTVTKRTSPVSFECKILTVLVWVLSLPRKRSLRHQGNGNGASMQTL